MRCINRFLVIPLVLPLASLLACSSGSPDTSATVDSNLETTPLTCSSSVADFCATAPCDRDLAVAKQDPSLCPASLIHCGDYDVILKGSADTATNYYYQGDQLVAVEHIVFPSQFDCLAGPAMFNAPECATTNQPLPACGPGPR
jgi:hypothetical protein